MLWMEESRDGEEGIYQGPEGEKWGEGVMGER